VEVWVGVVSWGNHLRAEVDFLKVYFFVEYEARNLSLSLDSKSGAYYIFFLRQRFLLKYLE
jgi:hypothetical protein